LGVYKVVKSGLVGMCFSALLMGGCSSMDMKEMVSSGNAMSTSAKKLERTDPQRVKIFDTLPKRAQVVGRIAADNYSIIGMTYSQETVMNQLKKQAASVGGNGVYGIEHGLTQTTAKAILVK
jgi:PBP1b-binding outer membrane lipoprotein LpoB